MDLALVSADGSMLQHCSDVQARGQAEHLLPALGRLLASAGINSEDIEKILVANGPGNFTGIRIGLSIAKGLGLGYACPVYGVSLFEQLIAAANRTGLLEQLGAGAAMTCIIPGRAGYGFAQRWQGGMFDGAPWSDELLALIRSAGADAHCLMPAGLSNQHEGCLTVALQVTDLFAAVDTTPPDLWAERFLAEPIYIRDAAAIPANPLFSVAGR